MLPDAVDNLGEEQKRLYISVLALICSADGELVREEVSALEQAMGRALVHPESRSQMRQLLANPPHRDDLLSRLDEATARLALRDGFLIAACDGDYDSRELSILAEVHAITGLDEIVIDQLIEWVSIQWQQSAHGRELVLSPILGDESALGN